MRHLALLFCLASFSSVSGADVIETVAGGGSPIDVAADETTIGALSGAASFGGEWYFAVKDKDVVLKRDSGGTLRLVAGSLGVAGFAGDGGPATVARLNQPRHIAFDSSGNLYIVDSGNIRVRKVDVYSGIISTVAGGGSGSASGVPATSVSLSTPDGIVVSTNGDFYVSERDGARVRKVEAATGTIVTVAGNGATYPALSEGGQATSGAFVYPRGLALGDGYLFVGLRGALRRVSLSDGTQNLLAGNGSAGSSGDFGPALSATVDWLASLSFDPASHKVYFVEDNESGCVACANKVRVLNDGYVDLASVNVSSPTDVVVDGSDLVVSESKGILSRFSQPGPVQTVLAGTGGTSYCCDGQPAATAMLGGVSRLALDPITGKIAIADYDNLRVRAFDPASGIISTLAGSSGSIVNGANGDGGAATDAKLAYTDGVAYDAAGNLYIASSQENRVRKVAVGTGVISTIAGGGNGADGGQATAASVVYPVDVAVNTSTATLYVAQRYNGRIRAVNLGTGVISTIAGDGTTNETYVDGQPAANLKLSGNIGGIAVDPRNGDLYIADASRHTVLWLNSADGKVYRVAGQVGQAGNSVDGLASSAYLNYPSDVDVDPATGDVYIASRSANRVKRLSGGNLSNVAGTGTGAYFGDGGDPLNAGLKEPQGVLVVGSSLYISDSQNQRLRRIGSGLLFTPTATPTVSNTPSVTPIFSPTDTRSATVTFSVSPTPSPTVTRTATISPTYTPTPVCPGGTEVGGNNSSTTSFGGSDSGYTWFYLVQPASTGIMNGLWIYTYGTGNIRVAVYNGNVNNPNGYALAESLDTADLPSASWVWIPLTSPVTLTGSAYYWFSWQFTGTRKATRLTSMPFGTVSRKVTSYDAFPSASGATALQSGVEMRMYTPLCPLPTATPSSTASGTRSPTFTVSPVQTTTPICAFEYKAGEQGLQGSTLALNTYSMARNISISANARLELARIYVNNPAGAQIKALLYSDSAGKPDALMTSSSAIAAVTGWNEINMDSLPLTAGTYWISFVASNGTLTFAYSSAANGSYLGFTGPNFDNPATSFASGGAIYTASIGAVYCLDQAGSPTNTRTISPTNSPSPSASPTFTPGTQCIDVGITAIQATNIDLSPYFMAQSYSLPQNKALNGAYLWVQTAAPGALIQAALYADNAGIPGARLALSSPQVAVAGAWNYLPITTGELAAGTYWLAAQAQNSVNVRYINGGTQQRYKSVSFGNLSDPAPSGTTPQLLTVSYYASFCDPADTPTVSPTASPSPLPVGTATTSPTTSPTPSPSRTASRTITVSPTITLSRTASPSVSPSQTASATASSTVTLSPTESPLASASPTPAASGAPDCYVVGAYSSDSNLTLADNILLGQVTVTAATSIDVLGVVARASSPSQVRLAIYSDYNASPKDLLAETGVINVPTSAQFTTYTAAISTLALTPGSYWLGLVHTSGLTWGSAATGNIKYTSQTFGPFSSPLTILNSAAVAPPSVWAGNCGYTPGPTATSSPTGTATLTRSPTPTFSSTATPSLVVSATPSATTSPTFSVSPTSTQSPVLSGCVSVGVTSIGGSNSTYKGMFVAQSITVGTLSLLQSLNLHNAGTGGGNLALALYSDNAGTPGSLVASASTTSAVAGWNTLSLPEVAIAAGTYWTVFISRDNAVKPSKTSGSFARAAQLGYISNQGIFPATAPAGLGVDGFTYSLYVGVCDSLTGSPSTPTPTATPSSCPVLGNTRGGGTTSYASNTIHAVRITVTASTDISALHVYLEGSTANFISAIYTDHPGYPEAVIAQSAVKASVVGWNDASIPLTNLAPGNYWLATWAASNDFFFDYPSTQMGYHGVNAAGAPLGSWTYGGSGAVSNNLLMYADACPGAAVSPSATPTATSSATATPVLSATGTATSTSVVSPTDSPTVTSLVSPTATMTATALPTASNTVTLTSTLTQSFTAIVTFTHSFTGTASATPSGTVTVTLTKSATLTSTPTPTASLTATATAIATLTDSPTVTVSTTASATLTASPSLTMSPSATPSGSMTNSPTPSKTATASPTATFSPTISPTPSISPTWTESPTPRPTPPFLQVGPGLPPVVVGTGTEHPGSPICLYSRQPVLSSSWTIFNAIGHRVATLSFGAESSQCAQTATFAAGIYHVFIRTTFADGTTTTTLQTVSLSSL